MRESVELGYATTIHAAQGVTADTMHGLITGDASRQQLYTMLTRGRTTNHVYLAVVGDGDPHTAIHPDTLNPRTGTELLEQILTRDDTPTSATTLDQTLHNPAQRLGTAVDRYLDALHAAAEDVAGPEVVAALDQTAEHAVPGLTQEPAWPTLRAHLLLRSAAGANPHIALTAAAATRQVDTATDRAAVIHIRIATLPSGPRGPLPWLPDIPAALADHPRWGSYLTGRARLIDDLAHQVRLDATDRFAGDRRPAWAADIPQPPVALTGDVETLASGHPRRHPRPATDRTHRPRRSVTSLAAAARPTPRRGRPAGPAGHAPAHHPTGAGHRPRQLHPDPR